MNVGIMLDKCWKYIFYIILTRNIHCYCYIIIGNERDKALLMDINVEINYYIVMYQ